MSADNKKEYLSRYRLTHAALKRTERQIFLFGENGEILNEQQKYREILLKMKNELDLIENPLLKELLTQKYLMGLSLSEIADNLNYSRRQAVRLHKKALELFKIL